MDNDVVRQNSILDGKERLIVPHALTHFPMFVAVSDTTASILGPWADETRVLLTVTCMLELAIAEVMMAAIRHLKSHERLQAAEGAQSRAESDLALAEQRARAAHTLHMQERRMDTALQNMLQGLFMVDHDGKLLVVNRRFCQLFGLPSDIVTPGMTYAELNGLAASQGNLQPIDVAVIGRRRAELLEHNERSTSIWELSDGRAFTVTHQPMEEGRLTTIEDITERRVAEARIAHLAHHDVLTDLPNRVLFHDTFEHALALARRGHLLALHYLDLDQFKAVNDILLSSN